MVSKVTTAFSPSSPLLSLIAGKKGCARTPASSSLHVFGWKTSGPRQANSTSRSMAITVSQGPQPDGRPGRRRPANVRHRGRDCKASEEAGGAGTADGERLAIVVNPHFRKGTSDVGAAKMICQSRGTTNVFPTPILMYYINCTSPRRRQ